MPITYKHVEKFPEEEYLGLVARNLEVDNVFIPVSNYREAGDETFAINARKIRIGAYDEDKLIGLTFGIAVNKNRFMMHISLVEPPYRGQGIYSKLLTLMLEATSDYDEIDSFHHIFNNRIIATKLKRGFHIIGMDQSILVGPRLQLRYYNNKTLLELMKFRVGLREDPRG